MMKQGTLYCVGIGPGGENHITMAAREAIARSTVVVGYKIYIDFIPDLIGDKRILSSGMKKEIDRCRQALDEAKRGETVALISSGDAGIYGMAGLAMEIDDGTTEIEVVPGVSAVQAAASRLGAPLMHDFAVISLSDLMTPWQTISRRLAAAASSDMIIALYNPRSNSRVTQLDQAQKIIRRYRKGSTPVGIVRNACRAEESISVATLADFTESTVDMMSLVIVGNSETRFDQAGRLFTPRGYGKKYLSGDDESAKTRNLFIGGTGSDVGKSIISAGLCRIFSRQGLGVAPFKSQNMALNSAVTPDGGEIGRAQALQASACELDAHVDMNPILLKPNSDTGSQVIVHGKVVGNMDVQEYHAYKETAFTSVMESFERLKAKYPLIVVEGAGSIAEINLKENDIANMRIADACNAKVILVADIDRGGVFASIIGTIDLMTAEERELVGGIIINRFRGDPSLLKEGIEAIEERTGIPVVGVIPWITLRLPEEDSVPLAKKEAKAPADKQITIGVLKLPRMSNYTDFDPLEQEADVRLKYIENPFEIQGVDLLIVPGTKSTIADLDFLRKRGLSRAIRAFHSSGGHIIGICGGFQMLGMKILDPGMIESSKTEIDGLGLLNLKTTMQAVKQTHQAEGVLLDSAGRSGLMSGGLVKGYEIHMGDTKLGSGVAPFAKLTSRSGETVDVLDGAVSQDGRIWGTYLHGIFDDDLIRSGVLAKIAPGRKKKGGFSGNDVIDKELNRLADHLEEHLDMAKIRELIGLE